MELKDYCERLEKIFDNDVIVKVMEPPSYITSFNSINSKDLIIFIYREEKKQVIIHHYNELNLSNGSEKEESMADLSVTGHPLECNFEKDNLDVSFDNTMMVENIHTEDHYYEPITLMEARKCLSFVSMKLHPPLPVWILADASDKKRTFLLSCNISNKWNTRSWALAHSNQMNKLPIKDIIYDFDKTFKLDAGFERTSAVSCVFDIKDEPGIAKNSKCFLEVNWQEPTYEVPIKLADTFLLIECCVGQEQCQVSRWWQQLIVLQKYLDIIKKQKESCKLQMTYQKGCIELPSYKSGPIENTPLATRVQELMKTSDSMSICRQLGSKLEMSALNATIQHLLKDSLQKGEDVCDRLWNLLIEAETYQELAECFHLIILEARKPMVHPYIFSKNKTRLACLLRTIKTSPDLELLQEPLELMVEVGLEKLKRDYIFIFMSSQLTTMNALSQPKLSSFSEVPSSKWIDTVQTQMQWLAQVHTVLELVTVIHSNLSTSSLVQVTSQALKTYVHPKDTPIPSLQHLIDNRNYVLRAPVLTREVRNFIEGERLFHKWMLKLTAESEHVKISSSVLLLEESPLPQEILNQVQSQDLLNDSGNLTTSLHASDTLNLDTKLQEKYTYIQLCTMSNKLPY